MDKAMDITLSGYYNWKMNRCCMFYQTLCVKLWSTQTQVAFPEGKMLINNLLPITIRCIVWVLYPVVWSWNAQTSSAVITHCIPLCLCQERLVCWSPLCTGTGYGPIYTTPVHHKHRWDHKVPTTLQTHVQTMYQALKRRQFGISQCAHQQPLFSTNLQKCS